MRIQIGDDFDLKKILQSGQCFRVKEEDGVYSFITGSRMILIRRESGNEYEVSCGRGEWESVWKPYFDLDRDYRGIRCDAAGMNSFIDRVMEIGKGLRILRQDPWEMLLTFIISQRKSIPAIRTSVGMLAERFGSPIEMPEPLPECSPGEGAGLLPEYSPGEGTGLLSEYSPGEGTGILPGDFSKKDPGICAAVPTRQVNCFPTAARLRDVTEEELKACALGYRVPYVMDAVRRVNSGELDLEALADLRDEELLLELQRVHGVGKKVANCVGLFGYGRTTCVPVDVWISRAIEEECCGEDPFACYGENAGIMQQYVFYYKSTVVRKGR